MQNVDGIWRVTYAIMGKKMILERKHEYEAYRESDDLNVYGALTNVTFIQTDREPIQGIKENDQDS